MVVRVIKSRPSVHVVKRVVRIRHRKKSRVEESPVASRVPYPNPNKTVVPLPDKGVVSVIMPAYRSARYIGEAVQSALDQEMPSGWEVEVLIGVDGCSETLEAAKQVRKKQGSRVRLFAVKKNGGQAAMANLLVSESAGELIQNIDSDDTVPSDRFLAQFAYLKEHHDVDLVGGGFSYTGRNCLEEADRIIPDPKQVLRQKNAFQDRVVYCTYGTWCAKRRVWDLVGGNSLRVPTHIHDVEMVMRILAHPDLYVRNQRKILLYYRLHPHQTTERVTRTPGLRSRGRQLLRHLWADLCSGRRSPYVKPVYAPAVEVP